MGDKKTVFWINVIAGPLLGGFAAYFISVSVLAEYSWCIVGEQHCVREWFGATSGWLAFAAAVITLPILWQQVIEARRQVAFTVGDSEPEFIVYRNRRESAIYLTVRNWNRRRVMIGKVAIQNGNGIVVDDVSDKNDPSRISRKKQKTNGESGDFLLDGWTDRNNSPPPERSLTLHLLQEGEPITDAKTLGSALHFEIGYRILGQTHERRLAKAITSIIDDE